MCTSLPTPVLYCTVTLRWMVTSLVLQSIFNTLSVLTLVLPFLAPVKRLPPYNW
ncbi:MAG: hypothetical protein NXY57DRAFT_970454 [Lentinula lateritia]|nr:MAG: hypothetical protein NXY57DRAFT_970454 [Lentinula lateritia]